MREKSIRVGVTFGLLCLAGAVYAMIYRSGANSCVTPDGCDIPVANNHPYTGLGVVLGVVGFAALVAATVLAARRRTAS